MPDQLDEVLLPVEAAQLLARAMSVKEVQSRMLRANERLILAFGPAGQVAAESAGTDQRMVER